LKVWQGPGLAACVLGRRGELRLREHRHPALQGRVRSAVRGTASSGSVTGKPEPRPYRARRQSANSPRRGGFRRHEPPTLSNFGRGRHARPPKCNTALPRLCEAAVAPTVGPETLYPLQPFQSPLSRPKGTKEPKKNSLARNDQESPQPDLRTWDRRARIAAPQLRPARHSPMRSPWKSGT
jgi:hypothetical protein